MKTYHASHPIAYALTAALLLTACDAAGTTDEEIEYVTFTFEEAEVSNPHPKGRYRTEGRIVDQGSFEETVDLGGPEHAPTALYCWRKLTSSRGDLEVLYVGYFAEGTDVVRGVFEVLSTSGIYTEVGERRGAFELRLSAGGTPEASSIRIDL